MSGARVNMVSGGYIICRYCQARLERIDGSCPHCESGLEQGGYRIVRAREVVAPRRLPGQELLPPVRRALVGIAARARLAGGQLRRYV